MAVNILYIGNHTHLSAIQEQSTSNCVRQNVWFPTNH